MAQETFHDWGDFYLVTGAAAGALIGLMFVVITLLAGRDAERLARGAQVYITPIVFHYAMVLVLSALGVVPRLPQVGLALLLATGAVIGFMYTSVTTLRVLRMPGDPHWSDKYYYGVLPALTYMLLGVAAALLWTWTEMAADLVGLVTIALLLVAIRNAWDLATTITQDNARKAGDRSG